MIIDNQVFIDQVRALYLRDPGAISNIAYHKLEGLLKESTTYQIDEGDKQGLYALRRNQLIFYWSNQQERFLVPPEQLDGLSFLVLHGDYYHLVADTLANLTAKEGHPLFYDYTFRQSLPASGHYEVTDFNFADDRDYLAAAEIITGTKTGYTVSPKRVRNWMGDRAFDPSLWLLARERCSGQPVGVGISAYYVPIQEADLDWFFVDPAHQGKGIGRMLIAATVARCLPKAKIIRLGGIADDFYQKCGFRRGDRWFVIS
ncbi:MAG TPA: hypothetical protein DDZ53_08510 [Firmicutes bacterium]|nr:hypothetical protein [Bacillota bacterium]